MKLMMNKLRKKILAVILITSAITMNVFAVNIDKQVFAQNITDAFYVFPIEIEGIEEEFLKIPHDGFLPQTIVATKGDNITIKFYNTETHEPHTFTLDNPYNINQDLKGGENATINFVADKEGVFTYYCIYHLPTMVGQFVVLPEK